MSDEKSQTKTKMRKKCSGRRGRAGDEQGQEDDDEGSEQSFGRGGERDEQRDRRVRPIAERGLRRNANPFLALAVRSMDLLLKNVRQKNELQMPD